jgi:plastocyanin
LSRPFRNVPCPRCHLGTKERLPLSLTRIFRILSALAVGTLACHCGSSMPAANTITVSNFLFSPTSLSVAPGTTITVVNQDSMTHAVTSQTAMGALTPGEVNGVSFDTGAFLGTTTFAISSTATVGTVVPYYCAVHLLTMGMNQGQINIVAQ